MFNMYLFVGIFVIFNFSMHSMLEVIFLQALWLFITKPVHFIDFSEIELLIKVYVTKILNYKLSYFFFQKFELSLCYTEY